MAFKTVALPCEWMAVEQDLSILGDLQRFLSCWDSGRPQLANRPRMKRRKGGRVSHWCKLLVFTSLRPGLCCCGFGTPSLPLLCLQTPTHTQMQTSWWLLHEDPASAWTGWPSCPLHPQFLCLSPYWHCLDPSLDCGSLGSETSSSPGTKAYRGWVKAWKQECTVNHASIWVILMFGGNCVRWFAILPGPKKTTFKTTILTMHPSKARDERAVISCHSWAAAHFSQIFIECWCYREKYECF